ncbi:MAG: leucine-rich repeat domain-containing protein [Pseudomonadota bacterium]
MSEEEEFSEAERAGAYEFARQKITEAKAEGATRLDLDLRVTDNKIRALTTLPPEIAELTALTELDLSNTQVSDLTALAGLSGLQTLYLNSTQVSDLTALAGLSGLQTLYLNSTQVSDLTALEGLSGLQRLYLDNTQVFDLTALESLGGLLELWLTGTQVSDLTALARLSGLQELSLSGTQVSDLTALARLSGLHGLHLNNTQVADLTELVGLSGLQTLGLDNTQVADLLPLAGLSKLGDGDFGGLWFQYTPAADRDAAHRALAAIESYRDRAKQVLQYLNGEHPEFRGPPEPYHPPITPFEFTSQDKAGIQFKIDGYLLRLDVHSDPPATDAEKLLPELQDSVEDLIDTFENPNSVMARGVLRRAKRMQAILSNSATAIAEEAVVLWQLSVALGSYMDEHALAVADRADPLDRLSASRMGALQRVIEASSVFVRLFPSAEALDDSRGGFLRDKFGPDRVRAFLNHTTHAQVLDEQSVLFIKGLAEIAARQGPQSDKARSVTMTGLGSLIRIVGHYGKGAITGIALGVGASIGGEIDDEFQLGVNAAQMLRDGEQEVRAILADLAPDVRNSVRGMLEEIFGSDVPLPPRKPPAR